MADVKEDRTLDCTGLLCPMPVVKTNKEMRGLEKGQILKILATDRGAIADFPAWAEDTGNQILSSGEDDGVLFFYIEKGEEE
ncbi:MAG: sulfurtransferase TusA family protein [Actinomycetota bacterium]